MARVVSLFELACEVGALSEAEFLARFDTPYLHFPSLPDLEPPEGFKTLVVRPGARAEEVARQGVAAVTKDEFANAFGLMITMGRAANNDIVVPDERVSKFHGYFQDAGHGWTYTDAGSTNGTRLNDAKLPACRPRPLDSHATLALSNAILAQFLFPSDLFALLQELRLQV